MLKFEVNDQYKKISKSLASLFVKANKIIGDFIKEDNVYDVNIVNDKQIKQINSRYRRINKPTDVLAFAFHEHGIKTPLLGEIFINYEQAARQTKETYEYEMALLFIHGVLHLLGYDHYNKQEQGVMFRIQNKVMKELNLVR